MNAVGFHTSSRRDGCSEYAWFSSVGDTSTVPRSRVATPVMRPCCSSTSSVAVATHAPCTCVSSTSDQPDLVLASKAFAFSYTKPISV